MRRLIAECREQYIRTATERDAQRYVDAQLAGKVSTQGIPLPELLQRSKDMQAERKSRYGE